MAGLYQTFLYQPILNALVFLYNIIPGHDVGVAIIVLTIVIRFVLYPLTAKSIRSQRELQRLQPKLQEIQKKYKDQKELLTKETMALYKSEKINPFSSCLPLLVQLPFLIAVFSVFRHGLTDPTSLNLLYPFIHNPGQLNPVTFNVLNLAVNHNLILALLSGAAQFWQGKMLVSRKPTIDVPGSKDESMAAAMNAQMTYMMPLVTAYISWALPAGLVLYIIITTLFTITQQYIVFKKHDKPREPLTGVVTQ